MKRLRHPLIVVSLIAVSVMLVVVALSPSWAAQSIAVELRQRIDAGDEPTAASLIEPLATLDDAALPHLIELLDDERAVVRQATRRAMSQRLTVWSDERTTASVRNIERLAHLLATHEPPREFHSRAFMKVLTLKLLRCSVHLNNAHRVDFLANCSAILERSLSSTTEETTAEQPARDGDVPATFEMNDAAMAALPLEPYSPPTEDVTDTEAQEPTERDEASSQPPAEIELHRPLAIGHVLEGAEPRLDESALNRLPTRSLIRRLHGTPEVAQLAEAELSKRGFDDQSIEIARQLDHADPKVRQLLAESLPRMPGVNAAPWLWELAEDENENVRRAARNILATSSNPQTRARVSRLK